LISSSEVGCRSCRPMEPLKTPLTGPTPKRICKSYAPSPVCSSFSQPGRHWAIRFASVKKLQTAKGEVPSNSNWPSILMRPPSNWNGHKKDKNHKKHFIFCAFLCLFVAILLSCTLDGCFNRAAGIYTGEIEPIVRRCVDVIQGDDPVAGLVTCGFEDIRRRSLTFQGGFRFVRSECMATDARNPDRYAREHARIIELNYGRHDANGKA